MIEALPPPRTRWSRPEPAENVTVPPLFTTGVRIPSVFVSALVDARVQVDTPEASPTEQAPMTFALPVAENVGISPATGLLLASFRVIVTVELATPSATTGLVPVIVEFVGSAAPAPGSIVTSTPGLTGPMSTLVFTLNVS